MKFNEHIAISAPRVLLVPYEARHVPRYHAWMKDPEIQELTASEPLTLEEEYENQASWRASGDKLTFILCLPAQTGGHGDGMVARGGIDDAEGRMLGDVNLFLYPDPDAEGEGRLFAEVDVMLAEASHRRNGRASAAVKALLVFLRRNLAPVLAEYAAYAGLERPVKLDRLAAKIKASNEASRGLFAGLGFVQRGEVNYFGEVEMVLAFGGCFAWEGEGYEEMEYEVN